MIIAKLPFERFLNLLRVNGRKQGFVLLVIFIAREADCPHIFEQLEKAWASLHDLTGKTVLFATIDGTNYLPVENHVTRYIYNEEVGSIKGNHGAVIYSPQLRLLQKLNTNVDYKDIEQWTLDLEELTQQPPPKSTHKTSRWSESLLRPFFRPTRRASHWRDEQTLGISSLTSKLEKVDEKDIPCLYFECLLGTQKFVIPVSLLDRSKTSIYSLLKATLSNNELMISEIHEKCVLISTLEKSIITLREKLNVLHSSRPPVKYRKLADSKEWLEKWLYSQSSVAVEITEFIEKSLLARTNLTEVYTTISSLSHSLDKRTFSELRAHLNRMAAFEGVDLSPLKSELSIKADIEAYQLDISQLKQQISIIRDEISAQASNLDGNLERTITDMLRNATTRTKYIKEKLMEEQAKRVIHANNYFERVEGDYHEHNYAPSQNLTEAAKSVKELLDHLAETYPNATESVVISTIETEIRNSPTLRNRLIYALQSGGIEALKVIFNHPFISISIEAVRGFLQAEEN